MEARSFWEECAAQANQDRRSGSRLTLAIPIQVAGMNSRGELFSEETETINVSETGCRFSLRASEVLVGAVLALRITSRRVNEAAPGRTSFFRVQWCKRDNNGKILVGAMQLQQENIWDLVFPEAQKQAIPVT